eukprot:214710_1
MTSVSQSASASSSSMSAKSELQYVPDDLLDVLNSKKSSLNAVWQMDMLCLSRELDHLTIKCVKSLLIRIALVSYGEKKDTCHAYDFMKSVFGREMMNSLRQVFATIQDGDFIDFDVDYLFIRFPKAFMLLGRLIGRNFRRVKAAIQHIMGGDGVVDLKKAVNIDLDQEPVHVNLGDDLYEQLSELTHPQAIKKIDASTEVAHTMCGLKRMRKESDTDLNKRIRTSSRSVSGVSKMSISGNINCSIASNGDSPINIVKYAAQNVDIKKQYEDVLGLLKSRLAKLVKEASDIVMAGPLTGERQKAYDSLQSQIRDCCDLRYVGENQLNTIRVGDAARPMADALRDILSTDIAALSPSYSAHLAELHSPLTHKDQQLSDQDSGSELDNRGLPNDLIISKDNSENVAPASNVQNVHLKDDQPSDLESGTGPENRDLSNDSNIPKDKPVGDSNAENEDLN